MPEFGPLIELARALGYPGLVLITVLATAIWLSNQFLKIRQQLNELSANKAKTDADEIVRAIEVIEKLRSASLTEEELEAVKRRLLKLEKDEAEVRQVEAPKSTNIDAPFSTPLSKGESIGGLLSTGSFMLLWGAGWGAGGTTFAFGFIAAIYSGFGEYSVGGKIGLTLLSILVLVIWFGLFARLAAYALFAGVKSYAAVLGRLFPKTDFGKRVLDWSGA